jgi:hypothetical protein
MLAASATETSRCVIVAVTGVTVLLLVIAFTDSVSAMLYAVDIEAVCLDE